MDIPGYDILSPVGKGGMASVYMAVQESFNRRVAIKVMSPALLSDDSFAKRFLQEARIVAQLNHPHIVPVYDVGQSGDFHYLAMEYVQGGHLKEHIREGISPEKAERVLREIASALDYAGRKGFVHRDVKPDNIMFRDDGSAVLMDFGIARAAKSRNQMTQVGMVVGTPTYMSPEQHRGHELDMRSDLYSLGVVFFEMLTGKPPYRAEDPMAVGIKHIQDPVPVLPEPLAHYQTLVNKLLAKDPDERFQDGAGILAGLEALHEKPAPARQTNGAAAARPARAENTAGTGGKAEPTQQAKASSTQTTSKPGNPATNDKTRQEAKLEMEERKEKTGLLSRRLVFDITVTADDYPDFQKCLDDISGELLAWYRKRLRKAGAVRFNATIHPWISGRVKNAISSLRKSDSHAFLRRLPVHVHLTALDGEILEEYELSVEEKRA